jgi:hypothetical protein
MASKIIDQNGPVRVLHIITGLSTGGAEQALHNLLSSGLQAEFECHVLSLTPGGRYADWFREQQGIPVHSLDQNPGGVRVNLLWFD